MQTDDWEITFDQQDADEYVLRLRADDAAASATFSTSEAVAFFELVESVMGGYVAEMRAARTSFDRGDGPNGEPAGTWEYSVHADYLVVPAGLHEHEVMRAHTDLVNKTRKENR